MNLANANGDTLLMLAAYHGHPTTAQVLIERGADVDRTNDRGQTPSPASGWCPQAGAVFKGEDDVVRLLLGAGADPRAGVPSAFDTAEMFGLTGYLEMFGGDPQK